MAYERFPLPPDEEETLLASGSNTEMTGLIPAGRPDEAERESYQDVLPYLPHLGRPNPAI